MPEPTSAERPSAEAASPRQHPAAAAASGASGEGRRAGSDAAIAEPAVERLCTGIVEACWLAALIAAPLFFNSYSDREVLPDKVALVRGLALVGLAAWLAKLALRGSRVPWRERVRGLAPAMPVLAAASLLAGAYLLASLFSVAPRASWLGSYERGEGACTLVSYLILFGLAFANLRSWQQVQRLIDVTLAASFCVSAYSILQHLHGDPVPWGQDTSVRAISTLGNPIFVGAYLIMTMPLTALRLRERWQGSRGGPPVWGFGVLLAVQLVALTFSVSRGPALGLLAGVGMAGVVVLAAKRPKILVRGAIVAVALGALIIAGGSLGARTSLGQAQPFGFLAGAGSLKDPSSEDRQSLWRGALGMMEPHAPIVFPNGAPDRFNALRPVVGFGPETMAGVFNQFYQPEIAQFERDKSWDRPHNETLHALVSTGLLGLVAYLALFAALLHAALSRVSPLFGGGGRRYALLCAAGAVSGALCLAAWKGLAFVGLGLSLGLLAGVIGHIAYTAARNADGSGANLEPLPLALLAALTAHFVETQVGIAVVATWLLLWLFAGLLLALDHLPRGSLPVIEEAVPASRGRARRRAVASPAPGSWMAAPLLSCFAIILSFDFIRRDGNGRPASLLLVVVGLVVASLLLAPAWRQRLASLGLAVGIGLVFLVYQLTTLGQQASGSSPEAIVASLSGRAGVFAGFALWLLALALWAAFGLARVRPSEISSSGGYAVVGGGLLLAAGVAFAVDIRPVQAEILYKAAQSQVRAGSYDGALQAYERVAAIAPHQAEYRLGWAQAYAAAAKAAADQRQQMQLFQGGYQQLLAARAANPLDPTHSANIARLLRSTADVADEASRPELLARAEEAYQAALRVAPFTVSLWDEWARFDLSRDLREPARQKLDRAAAIDPRYNSTFEAEGEYWSSEAGAAADAQARAQAWQRAADSYNRAVVLEEEDMADGSRALATRLGLSVAYMALDRPVDAQKAYQQALTRAPREQQWSIYRDLAAAYLAAGDKPDAATAARRARALAPAAEQPNIDALIAETQ